MTDLDIEVTKHSLERHYPVPPVSHLHHPLIYPPPTYRSTYPP